MPDVVVEKKEEIKKQEAKQEARPEVVLNGKDILKQSVADGIKEIPKEEVKTEVKEEVKTEIKEEVKPEVNEEEDRKAIQKRIQRLLEKNKEAVAPENTTVEDSIDELEVKDGKVDIKKVSALISREVERAKRSVMGEIDQTEKNQEALRIRNEANKTVWEKHPEILEIDEGKKKHDEVPFAKVLSEVYQELIKDSPDFINLPKAPLIAMELAEKRFGDSESVRKARIEGAKKESERQSSVQASGVVSSGGGSGVQTSQVAVAISSDEQATARKMGMSDSEYAKFKKRTPIVSADYYAKYSKIKPRS
jgi:hypothetical protein